MIQKGTFLTPVDKCGVWSVGVFHLYNGGKRKVSNIGNFVKVSVKKTRPNNWVSKKTKSKAIIIHTKKEPIRLDGSHINFNVNSCVLLKKRLTPKGKELVGPSSRGLNRKRFMNSFVKVV